MTRQEQRARQAELCAAYAALRDAGAYPHDAGRELGFTLRRAQRCERVYRRGHPQPRQFGMSPFYEPRPLAVMQSDSKAGFTGSASG